MDIELQAQHAPLPHDEDALMGDIPPGQQPGPALFVHEHGAQDWPARMGGLLTTYTVEHTTFEEAKEHLLADDTQQFLQRLSDKELSDYTPLDDALRRLTALVHARLATRVRARAEVEEGVFEDERDENFLSEVLVIPRGSFISKTALKGSADLDIDLVLPDTYPIVDPDHPHDAARPIRNFLELDDYEETIRFEPRRLKIVLQTVWASLQNAEQGNLTVPDTITGIFQAARPIEEWTRSISAQTVDEMPGIDDGGGAKQLDIDLFIKIKTKAPRMAIGSRGGADIIVGVDKDGPGGLRRYQTTDYMPLEGKWMGDRVLRPVERTALLTLKWWKSANEIPGIKSHHLLTALNALGELDPTDPLYLRKNNSERFSLVRVMEVMRGILLYLNNAYRTPCNFLLSRRTADGDWANPDYPFPQMVWGIQDTLFVQFSQDRLTGGGLSSYQKLVAADAQGAFDFIISFERQLFQSIFTLRNPGQDLPPGLPPPLPAEDIEQGH